jgi:hypothetical protein
MIDPGTDPSMTADEINAELLAGVREAEAARDIPGPETSQEPHHGVHGRPDVLSTVRPRGRVGAAPEALPGDAIHDQPNR